MWQAAVRRLEQISHRQHAHMRKDSTAEAKKNSASPVTIFCIYQSLHQLNLDSIGSVVEIERCRTLFAQSELTPAHTKCVRFLVQIEGIPACKLWHTVLHCNYSLGWRPGHM